MESISDDIGTVQRNYYLWWVNRKLNFISSRIIIFCWCYWNLNRWWKFENDTFTTFWNHRREHWIRQSKLKANRRPFLTFPLKCPGICKLNFFVCLCDHQVNGSFPHHSVSILEIQTSLLWNSNPTTLNEFPLSNSQDGVMFFYR